MPAPHARKPGARSTTPRPFTPEEIRALGQRASLVAQQLHEATERMNEELCAAEDAFLEGLGPTAHGRVEIQRGFVQNRSWVEFLVYRGGEFFVESNRVRPRFDSTHMLSTSRDCRKLICLKLPELWVACGGAPLA